MYLRKLGLRLVTAPGVVVEMLSPAAQQADGSWRMTDLAWGAESWLAVRLHISAGAAGSLRDLLGATVEGTAIDGTALSASAPLLQLPTLDATALAALPRDETAHNRLEELAFSKAAEKLRTLAQNGDRAATQKALQALEQRFGEHPWLKAKIEQLRQLAEEDTVMMMKEVRYSMSRMSSRLVAKHDMAFVSDEMDDVEMPAFLRKKVSEGKGKQATPKPVA